MSSNNKRQIPSRNVQTFTSSDSSNKKQQRTNVKPDLEMKSGLDKRRIFEKGGRGDTKERGGSLLSASFVGPAVPPRTLPSSLPQKTSEDEGGPEYKSALDSAIRRLTDTLNNSKVEREAEEDEEVPTDIEEPSPVIDTMNGDDVLTDYEPEGSDSEPEIIYSNIRKLKPGEIYSDGRYERIAAMQKNLPKVEAMDEDEVEDGDTDESSSRSETPQTPLVDLTKEEPSEIDIEVDEDEPDVAAVAEVRRLDGNEFYKNKEYIKAHEAYIKSIEALPTQVCYGNLAACYIMMNRHKDAISASKEAIKLDPSFEKGYRRIVNCYIILGDIKEAEIWMGHSANASLPVDVSAASNISLIKSNRKRIEESPADPRTALFYIGKNLEISTEDLNLMADKSGALVKLKRFSEAKEICRTLLSKNENLDEAWFYHAICYYQEDNMEKAQRFILKALSLKLDNNDSYVAFYKGVKKVNELRTEAAGLFGSNSYTEANVKYFEALERVKSPALAPINDVILAKIEFNISLMFLRLGEYLMAMTHVNEAIKQDSKYIKALSHRAKLHSHLEAYDDAVKDYEKILELDPSGKTSSENRRLLSEAKLEAKKAKRKDYYKILGVDRNAGLDQIRKAYKKKALSFHPDRHSQASEAVKKEKEKQFKEIGEALEILSDEKKRNRYDNGEDLMESNYSDNMNQFYQSVFQTGRMGGAFNPHSFRPDSFRNYTHRF